MTNDFSADLETPVSAFLKLAPLQPIFLLESVEKSETIGRYSFIGILPQKFFILEDAAQCNGYFDALEQQLQSLPAKENGRLSSGLVGFLSYPICSLLHPKLNVKRSSEPLAGFVLPSAILAFDHLKNRIYLHSILSENEQDSLAKEIRVSLRNVLPLPKFGLSSEPKSNIAQADFYGMVQRAREFIASGDIYQVVLSMQFDGETEAHPFHMYRALRMINPSPYMFYLNFQDQFQFFGSSPETLVRTEGSKVLLRPIAGTRPRG
ncbi:MAG TPA: chorismate-binding protein, partial [Acidobacteriota bacterium]